MQLLYNVHAMENLACVENFSVLKSVMHVENYVENWACLYATPA